MHTSDRQKQGGGSSFNPEQKGMLWMGVLFIALLGPVRVDAQEKERTPASLLSAIEQRNQELEKRSKAASLKEQRLRILEQEIGQKLEEIKQVRDQMKAKEETEKKAKADAEAKKAKALAEAKKAEAIAEAQRVKGEEAANALEAIKTQAYEEGRRKAYEEMKTKPPPKKAEVSAKVRTKPKEMTKTDAKKERAKMAAEKRLARAKAASAKKKARAEVFAVKTKEKEIAATPDLPSMTLDALAALKKEEAARKAIEEKRFKDLAKIYEKMPPAEAALRLQNMHEVTALEIIPRMNKAKLARVLSSMDPVVAVRYTERIGMGGPFFPADTPPVNASSPSNTDSSKTP